MSRRTKRVGPDYPPDYLNLPNAYPSDLPPDHSSGPSQNDHPGQSSGYPPGQPFAYPPVIPSKRKSKVIHANPHPGTHPPAVTLRGISKIYKGILGINNISLDIYPGITGFLGPNGAGKSTTLKIIAGLVHPSSGHVTIFGSQTRLQPMVYSRVGYCPEHDAFYPDLTGRQFVSHFLRVRGIEQTRSEKMASIILKRLDMEEQMDRKIEGYSRGMKQKVKVAAAVVHNPDLLIMDEPLQGTDPEARYVLIQNMKQWAKGGMSIVVSSHILNEIERMTTRVVLINEGRIYAVGEMAQIRAMMVNRPLTIRITPRNPEDVRTLASVLVEDSSVLSVKVQDIHVIVHTKDAHEFYDMVPNILVNNNISINELMPTDDNLESLYYYLMTQRRW